MRALVTAVLFLLAIAATATELSAQNLLKNGDFESVENGQAESWSGRSAGGYTYSVDEDSAFEGKRCALLDSTEVEDARFGTFNQTIDVSSVRGKRVRFRAAVKTGERGNDGRAQLWFRVDRPDKQMGDFDNMGQRPIKSDQWDHYEIVADVADDATNVVLGVIIGGNVKIWIDDASLEIVDDDVKKTTMDLGSRANATVNAPTQPFFNTWLWLAGLVVVLWFYSQTPNHWGQRFALHFSVAYWFLYSGLSLTSSFFRGAVGLIGKVGFTIKPESVQSFTARTQAYESKLEEWTQWTANNVLGVDGELVSAMRNGSGDTTMAFVQVLIYTVVALGVAALWSGIMTAMKRSHDQVWIRDGLRTFLRYVLAATMLSYGLAKLGFSSTQFDWDGGGPTEGQLSRTYGDSSPMGLLWTFMAASPAYTFFAGLGETVGGILLVFRRTMTFGAFVTFGVMLNVAMLNYCYDVPVKLYSTHLAIMALIIAAPDFGRLTNVLFLNRPTEQTNLLTPPWAGERSVWVYRVAKAVVVVAMFAIPVYTHVQKEVTHHYEVKDQEKAESGHLLMDRGYRWINEYPFNR